MRAVSSCDRERGFCFRPGTPTEESRYRPIPGMPIAVRQIPRESRADLSSAARDPSSADAPANLRPESSLLRLDADWAR